MPQGTYWWDGPAAGGVQYPGANTAYNTRRNSWAGSLGRPGNEYQDSMSALSDLGPAYYTGYHTFGVDWRPGEVRCGALCGVGWVPGAGWWPGARAALCATTVALSSWIAGWWRQRP